MGAPLCYVFVSGYFKKIASNVSIEFFRQNGRFATPGVSIAKPTIEFPLRQGSQKIDAHFTMKSPLFFNKRYFRPLRVPLPHLSDSIVNAIKESRAYIEACRSKKGRKLDPEFCFKIGGHIHIATITATEGFDWVPGFKPKDKDWPVPGVPGFEHKRGSV